MQFGKKGRAGKGHTGNVAGLRRYKAAEFTRDILGSLGIIWKYISDRVRLQ